MRRYGLLLLLILCSCQNKSTIENVSKIAIDTSPNGTVVDLFDLNDQKISKKFKNGMHFMYALDDEDLFMYGGKTILVPNLENGEIKEYFLPKGDFEDGDITSFNISEKKTFNLTLGAKDKSTYNSAICEYTKITKIEEAKCKTLENRHIFDGVYFNSEYIISSLVINENYEKANLLIEFFDEEMNKKSEIQTELPFGILKIIDNKVYLITTQDIEFGQSEYPVYEIVNGKLELIRTSEYMPVAANLFINNNKNYVNINDDTLYLIDTISGDKKEILLENNGKKCTISPGYINKNFVGGLSECDGEYLNSMVDLDTGEYIVLPLKKELPFIFITEELFKKRIDLAK